MMPPATLPPTTTEDSTMVTDDDGKPIDPGDMITVKPTVMAPTTMAPTTMAPTTQSFDTTEPPETSTEEEVQPTTQPQSTGTDNSATTEKPTDYGNDDDRNYDDGDGTPVRRRRSRQRRDTFGAQPPSTAVDSELLVVTNSQGPGQVFTFVGGVPSELSVIGYVI